MRMWMVDPKILCRQHLLGEHNELHKLVGSIRKSKSLKGYLDQNIIEPESIIERHTELVWEMLRRGYNHQSPLPKFDITDIPKTKVSIDKSYDDLFNRCSACYERFVASEALQGEGLE